MDTFYNEENEERFEHFNKPEHEAGEEREQTAAGKHSFKGFKVEQVAEKVIEYIKQNNETIDKEVLFKYAAIAVLALFGLRRTGFVGSVLISAAVTVLAKHFLIENYEKTRSTEAEAA